MDPELVRHFETIDQRFETIIQRFEQLNVRLDTRFEAIDQQFGEMRERVEEGKRHAGVLVEGLRYEVHLVAEGLAIFIDGRYTQDQVSIQHQFRETQALMHLSYDQLRQRVENLERRNQN